MNFTLKKSDLNFKVYTVPSEPTAPGAENDIAVISSVPMTNWIMSTDKPSGISRTDGDVWIQYSTDGNTRNILKQNALMIATIGAWQYVDGAWVERKAVNWHGGKWHELIKKTYLFKNGDQCTNITGGWYSSGAAGLGAGTFGSTAMSFGNHSQLVTRNTINRGNNKKLYVNIASLTHSTGDFSIVLSPILTGSFSTVYANRAVTESGLVDIDISGVTNPFYLHLYTFNNTTATVDEVWME